MMEWHHFLPGEEPEVLTCISPNCEEGKHGECAGILSHQNAEGLEESVFCVCACHKKPASA
jgi:hypothetical protein